MVAIVVLSILSFSAVEARGQETCIGCHASTATRAAHAALLPAHANANTGCVSCHRGVSGAATKENAHGMGPQELLAGEKTQAACVVCHVAGVKGTDAVVRGGRVYLEQGCQLCHTSAHGLGNRAAFAPPLDTIGARGTAYLKSVLRNPGALFKGTVMPSYARLLDAHPADETALLAFLLSQRNDLPALAQPKLVRERCATCHAAQPSAATQLAKHDCRLLRDDAANFTCKRCHARGIPTGTAECLYILQRRQECGVCHEGALDGR